MEAGTWVALVLGVGSLAATLVLDHRNRAERTRRDRQEAAAKRDERWMAERRIAYAAYSSALTAWYVVVTDRLSDLMAGSAVPADDDLDEEDQEHWLLVTRARGPVDMLAPVAVREAAQAAFRAMATFGFETRRGVDRLDNDEQKEASARIEEMISTMRADLDVRDEV
ncbi:hypothetical protein [Cellulosimicrobium sp. TH-20]|uniref:hypothetical protein n=1 Tax=Cellulosimicrobium sp. TH-20 TaxID=1980001 RepID=UPI0011AB2BAD|nr:hypothetical protein [Cellulosimicrobium sp. TH-20]